MKKVYLVLRLNFFVTQISESWNFFKAEKTLPMKHEQMYSTITHFFHLPFSFHSLK